MKDGAAQEEKHIETVNRYMALVEGLLSEDAIEATAVAGNEEYQYGMKIGYTDLWATPRTTPSTTTSTF